MIGGQRTSCKSRTWRFNSSCLFKNCSSNIIGHYNPSPKGCITFLLSRKYISLGLKTSDRYQTRDFPIHCECYFYTIYLKHQFQWSSKHHVLIVYLVCSFWLLIVWFHIIILLDFINHDAYAHFKITLLLSQYFFPHTTMRCMLIFFYKTMLHRNVAQRSRQ